MLSMLIAASLIGEPAAIPAKGQLVVVGGGTTTNLIINKTLELAGGKSAKVAIIAAANPEYGPGSLDQWKRTDAAQVTLVNPSQAAAAVRTIRESNLIWLPGGLQGVFMNTIQGTGIAEAVRSRFREGAVVAGTSAGAAVMSRKMIGGRSDLETLLAGATPFLMDGLGLWPQVIVDQHFLQKGRFNRLALAVLEYPDLVGIGIDEETACIVRGNQFEVIGNGNVTVVDARKARPEKLVKGEPVAARNLRIHLLRSGMSFKFDE
jgi:cyanophycinase